MKNPNNKFCDCRFPVPDNDASCQACGLLVWLEADAGDWNAARDAVNSALLLQRLEDIGTVRTSGTDGGEEFCNCMHCEIEADRQAEIWA